MKVCTSAKFANFCPGLIRSDKHVTEHCTREGKHLHNDSDKTFAFEKKKHLINPIKSTVGMQRLKLADLQLKFTFADSELSGVSNTCIWHTYFC